MVLHIILLVLGCRLKFVICLLLRFGKYFDGFAYLWGFGIYCDGWEII